MAPLVKLKPVDEDPASHFLFETTQAAALFLRDGIEAVRMTDIAEASGVGVATLYRHFATKLRIAREIAAYDHSIDAHVRTSSYHVPAHAGNLSD